MKTLIMKMATPRSVFYHYKHHSCKKNFERRFQSKKKGILSKKKRYEPHDVSDALPELDFIPEISFGFYENTINVLLYSLFFTKFM